MGLAQVVYGPKPIIIAQGPREMMEAYAARMNEQAPQYDHRVVDVP